MSATKPPRLPGPLGQLQLRGYGGAAVRLVLEWGGQQRYIPFEPRRDSAVVAVIGLQAARVLCQIVREDDARTRPARKGDRGARGKTIDIPSRKTLEQTDAAAILRHEGGTRETAKAVGCTETYVRRIRNGDSAPLQKRGKPKDERQADLVDLLNKMHTEV